MLNNNEEILQFKDNIEINVSYQKSPEHFPLHWHDMAEFVLVFKDGCQFRIGNEYFDLKKDEILLIWPRELHEVAGTPAKATSLLQFPSYLIDSEPGIAPYQSLMRNHHRINPESAPELHAKLLSYMNQSAEIFASEESFYETELKILVMKILLAIAKYSAKETDSRFAASPTEDILAARIRAACSFIVQNYNQDISQTDVADYVGLSRFYFSRMFKDYMNISFKEYLSTQRINQATKLLADYSLSISDVAYQSGFQSISNFNKVFREKTGRSPKEYRTLIVQD